MILFGVVPINSDSSYYIGNNIYKGSEISKMLSSYEISLIALIGALIIGLVFGWLLGFINGHVEKSSLNMTYLVSAIGVLVGPIVLGFFNGAMELLGCYGIGLGLGLVIHIIFYIKYGKKHVGPWIINPDLKK